MPRNRLIAVLAVALVLVGAGVAAAVVLSDKGSSGTTASNAARTATVKTTAELPADAQPLPRSRARAVEPETGVPSSDDSGATDKNSPEYLAAHPPKSRAPTDDELRKELAAYRQFKASIDPRQFENELIPNNVLSNITGWQTSVASVFTDFGLPIACPVHNGILHRNDLGVAHKTLPCGTMVTFRWHGKGIRVPVIDRGPYIEGREWDFTGATAVALDFSGLGEVDWKIG